MVQPKSVLRRGLSRGRIVDTAVDLARSEGTEHLSMRRLAEHLVVQAMLLYYHLPSKTSLMTLMADRTLSELPAPDPGWPWTEQLLELMARTFVAAKNNPALFLVLAAEPMHPGTLPATRGTGAASLSLFDKVLQLLQQGGVPADSRADAFRGLLGLTIGFMAGQVDGLLPQPPAADRPTRDDEQRRSNCAPLLTEMTPALDSTDPEQALRFTLRLCIEGLQRLAAAGPPPEAAVS